MSRLLVVAVVAVAAALVALAIRRMRPAAPTRTGFTVPDQLDRADFGDPAAQWLVVLFSSATCSTCADVATKARALASSSVSVVEVEYQTARKLHERYRIEAVPALLIADREGVVRRSFLGPVSATHLWAAVAELREPGSTPPGCGQGPSETASA